MENTVNKTTSYTNHMIVDLGEDVDFSTMFDSKNKNYGLAMHEAKAT